jgi:hypothetical protein
MTATPPCAGPACRCCCCWWLTGLVIYLCGERLTSGWGGAFALCWFATMPVFLTFGPLVLTDTAVALFSLVALWSFATLWRDQSKRAARRFALALTLALLSKFSAGLLLFVFVAFPFVLRWLPLAGQPTGAEFRAWWRRGWRLTGKARAGIGAADLHRGIRAFVEPAYRSAQNDWQRMDRARPAPAPAAAGDLPGRSPHVCVGLRPADLSLRPCYSHGVWFFFPGG